MTRWRSLTVSLVLALLPMESPAASLIGYWYGVGYEPLWHAMGAFYSHEAPDGTFNIEFRVYQGCVITKIQYEGGRWMMLDEKTERVITTRVNWQLAGPWTDDYRFLELTDRKARCIHLATGVVYTEVRVDQSFKFPDCVPIS